MIKDQRSGKSKGVSYVEFYTQESVIKALALSGEKLVDVPVRVQASQAEKNRAAKAAKQQQAEALEGGPMKIYVGGLVESLANITEQGLRDLFQNFGEVVNIELHKDPYTGKCKGYAFISYRRAQEARDAMAAMNGFTLGDRQIKVGYAVEHQQGGMGSSQNEGGASQEAMAAQRPSGAIPVPPPPAIPPMLQMPYVEPPDNERLDDDGGGMNMAPSARLALMQRLQREGEMGSGGGAAGQQAAAAAAAAAAVAAAGQQQFTLPNLTNNLVLSSMFSPAEAIEEGASFFNEIELDVKDECQKHGGVVRVWTNRKDVDGRVWIRFSGLQEALRAQASLNGRVFNGNQIGVEFVTDDVWTRTVQ
eukprot:GHVU01007996.1.p1 GENE.GHVU01007996.1~~GHVU01007996.1.p1  ORF type:complete len:362 (+),score=85.82 GHVU01007996.1:686-1771(+)